MPKRTDSKTLDNIIKQREEELKKLKQRRNSLDKCRSPKGLFRISVSKRKKGELVTDDKIHYVVYFSNNEIKEGSIPINLAYVTGIENKEIAEKLLNVLSTIESNPEIITTLYDVLSSPPKEVENQD